MYVDKTHVLEIFKKIYSIQEEIKDFNSAIADFRTVLAKELEVKPDVITKAFSNWVLLMKDSKKSSEIDEIVESIR